MQFLAYGRMFQPQSYSTDGLILLISIPLLGWLGMKLWNRIAERTGRVPHVEHWVYGIGASAAVQVLAIVVFWSLAGQSLFYTLHGPPG